MRLPVVLAMAALLGAQIALGRGALGFLPEMVRLALAFTALILLPGVAIARLVRNPVEPVLALVPALGFGIAWNAALALALHLGGRPLGDQLAIAPFGTLLLLVLAARRGAPDAGGPPPLARGALLAVLLAALLASLHAGRTGTPVTYIGDSPDHVGTIRRMIETGNAFPTDAFFKDAGPSGADPRKGLWHPLVALIAMLAGVDPADAWLQLPALIAPFFVLNLARLGALSSGGAGAAVFAWAQLLLLAGMSQWYPLRKSVFATFLADQLCAAVAFAMLADVLRPSRGGRVSVVLLAVAAVACHVYSAIQLFLTLGALSLGLAVRERKWQGPLARAVTTSFAAGLAMVPYLLWRARQSYAPANEIHTESQGLLWLAGPLQVVSIGVLWDWMGKLWILFPIAWLFLARRLRDPAALYTLTVSVAVTLVIFNPLAVAVLAPRVGYLLMRMIWMVPIAALTGWLVLSLARAIRERRGAPRLAAAAALAGVALLVLPAVRDATATLATPQDFAAADRRISPLRWRDAMTWLDRNLPPGQVVLSDPATSYGVPMLTRHYVATLLDQHSSPSDPEALERILDARDALDPFSDWARTREVIAKRGVTIVIVNSDFAEPPRLSYWGPDPTWAARARARLESAPAAFERLYDRRGFTVYRVHRAALDTLSAPAEPRAFVAPYQPGRFPIGRRIAEDLPVIHRFRLWPQRIARGDTLGGLAEWRALTPMPAGSYRVSVRFDQELPGGFRPPAMIGKPARKVLETLQGRRYRFREDHVPVGGTYGVDLWRPDEVVRDSFRLVVPPDVAPGYYRAEVRINRFPHYPNFRLADYFYDRDYFSGIAMGAIEVVASREDLKRAPAPPPASMGLGH